MHERPYNGRVKEVKTIIDRRMIAFIFAVLVLALLYSMFATSTSPRASTESEVALVQLPVDAPPPVTPTMQAVVDASVGFSAFVSYTNTGFEPTEVSITNGQSVRFTNNSARTLWISAVAKDGAIYPAEADSCGQSEFDMCKAVAPNEIWEFKFDKRGVWGYRNNTEQTHVGVVRVN